ncbi:MAG: ribbon-helix-helix domain-containing protein [Hyphomicrobiaceae bacterium]
MNKRTSAKYWVLGVGYPATNPELITLHRRLHILSLDQDRTLQELVQEALTDLLTKYQSNESNDNA